MITEMSKITGTRPIKRGIIGLLSFSDALVLFKDGFVKTGLGVEVGVGLGGVTIVTDTEEDVGGRVWGGVTGSSTTGSSSALRGR